MPQYCLKATFGTLFSLCHKVEPDVPFFESRQLKPTFSASFPRTQKCQKSKFSFCQKFLFLTPSQRHSSPLTWTTLMPRKPDRTDFLFIYAQSALCYIIDAANSRLIFVFIFNWKWGSVSSSTSYLEMMVAFVMHRFYCNLFWELIEAR